MDFAAQYRACTYPGQRFAPTLANGDARLAAGVAGYAFTV